MRRFFFYFEKAKEIKLTKKKIRNMHILKRETSAQTKNNIDNCSIVITNSFFFICLGIFIYYPKLRID